MHTTGWSGRARLRLPAGFAFQAFGPLIADLALPSRLAAAARLTVGGLRVVGEELRSHLRLDAPLAILAAIYLLAVIPIVPHATRNPALLNSFIDDEPPLTMALDGMRDMPYGDPFNFILASINGHELPAYWDKLNYAGVGYYYGGTYFGLAFLVYGPLQALGLPAFPTAPIILRILSALSGLAALLITYNFARFHIGRIAAVIATLILLTDSYFAYYATIIHPDLLQLALGLLTLTVASRYVRLAEPEGLAALGLLSGVVQGTKSGGPWLIPMIAASVAICLFRHRPRLEFGPFAIRLVRRGSWLLLLAVAAYFVTTPYAFLKSDFFRYTRLLAALLGHSSMVPTSYVNWLQDLWAHFTPMILVPATAGVLVLICRAARGEVRWPLLLALLLGLSQLVWYSVIVRYWVELGYMLGLFAVIALLAGSLAQEACGAVARIGIAGRVGAAGIAGLAVLLIAGGEWYGLAQVALADHLTEANTVVQIGRWAEAGHIPRNARIMWDDVAYFDPAKFPHGRKNSLITYNDLYEWHPDYIVLSSSMYRAPHFAELIKTQHYTMQNEGPYSMRLYQGLLGAAAPGPTKVPGIDYVRQFAASPDCGRNGRPYTRWLGEAAPFEANALVIALVGDNTVGRWLGTRVSGQVALLNYAGRLVEAIGGRTCMRVGPTLRVYRVNKPGTPDGFSRPFASATLSGLTPLDAFDGDPSYWMPPPAAALNASIGFDFGGGGGKAVGSVRIDWVDPRDRAGKVEIQYADYGGAWRSAGIFDVTVDRSAAPSSTFRLPGGLGAHRLWRVVLRGVPADGEVKIREVRFLSGAGGR